MRRFTLIWIGQILSLTGSAMTTFGLTVWLWQETGQATSVALHAFLSFAPGILISPFAGVLVDRVNRKLILLASDVGAGLGTIAVLLLLYGNNLEVWHLYVIAAWSGTVGAFQVPALAAAITTLVPKQRLTRANAMRAMANTASQMLAPAMAGILLSQTGIISILLTDISTLAVAVVILTVVRMPSVHQRDRDKTTDWWNETLTGFRFLAQNRGLLVLTFAFAALQFFGMLTVTLLAPMVLARTGGDEAAYGLVAAATGAGGIIGAALMSVLPPPKRFYVAVGGGIMAGSVGFLALGLNSTIPGWMLSALFGFVFFPVVGAASAALKQRKTPLHIQGRVFAADQMLQTIGIAAGILTAGPLADLVFEPAFTNGAAWAAPFTVIVGSGAGAGMAALIVVAAIGGVLTGFFTLTARSVRTLEETMPDHDDDR